MTCNHAPFTALAVALACVTSPSPALAEDFTLEVPVQLTNVAPGARQLNVVVSCHVSSRVGSSRAADVIARERQIHIFQDPSGRPMGPVTDSRVFTIRMNGSRLRPASSARWWSCQLDVSAGYPGEPGMYDISTPSSYERVTRYRLVRRVINVDGEIPR